MDPSTPVPDDIRKNRSRRALKPGEGPRTQPPPTNITKPLPKTPPASPPTQLQHPPLPLEFPDSPLPTHSTTSRATTRVPPSSRTARVVPAATGHGHSRSTSSSKVNIAQPGSSLDARTMTGVHAAARANPGRGPSLDRGHARHGSNNAQNSREPPLDAENRRTAAGPPRTRRPSAEHHRARPSVDGTEAPRSASFDIERRNVGAGSSARPVANTRGSSVEHHGGRPSMDGAEAPRFASFDIKRRNVGTESPVRPVAKTRGGSVELPTRRATASTPRHPSIDAETRRPSESAVSHPRPRGQSFEADIKRPGVGVEPTNTRLPSLDRERRRAGVSTSDSGHAPPQLNESRKGPQGYPIRFNSTPTNPQIDHRGYTPVPATNIDDDRQNHTKETSTGLSHEKTLEDMPPFTYSRPYPSDKEDQDPAKQEFEQSMRRRRLRVFAVSFIITALLIVAIVLLAIFVRPQIRGAYNTVTQGSSSNSTLDADQSQCLSDFRTNAPANPASYACSSCLPAFQNLTQQFLQNSSNTNDINDIQAAKQFCGLQAVFNATAQFQGTMSSAGWLRDTQPCAWGGVACDASGNIVNLTMTFPAVPQSLPPEMSALTSLTNLMLTGDRSVPAGSLDVGLPPSLRSVQLYNTHLEGLQTADAAFFQQGGSFGGLTELILDGNPSLGTQLPTGLFNVQLQTLAVRNQQLNMPLDTLGNSGALASSLTTLDLSLNNLTGTLALLYLPHLTSINLSYNNLTLIPPTFTWPPALQSVHFDNNTLLTGTLAAVFCADTLVTDCGFQNTKFSTANITCGRCKF